ncbi:MAG: heme-binding protein [Rhizomicrobium sp.]
MTLTLDTADALVRVARKKAEATGVAVCVAVLDQGGHLTAFARMDRAWLGALDVSIRKAKSSVLFEAETQMIWEVCKPGAQAHGLEQTNGGLVTFAGGIPLKGPDGLVVGAIGVSGGEVAQDYVVAQAGAAAFAAWQKGERT